MTTRHHRIDYIEFTVRDLTVAKGFYAAAFGWEFTDYGPEYVGIHGGEKEMGGFAVGEPAAGAGPLVVLYSDNLEQTEAAVVKAGGQVTKEPFSFPGGSRFHFKDPSGNELAVWTLA